MQLLATSWWNDELAHVPESAQSPCDRCGEIDHAAPACNHFVQRQRAAWPTSATTLDYVWREISEEVHAAATNGTDLELKLKIPNTEDGTSTGLHWFTVAYSMIRK